MSQFSSRIVLTLVQSSFIEISIVQYTTLLFITTRTSIFLYLDVVMYISVNRGIGYRLVNARPLILTY